MTQDHAARLAEVVAWIKLTRSAGLSESELRALLKAFGLPENILVQPARELARLIGEQRTRLLRGPATPELEAVIAATSAWLERPTRHVVTLSDSSYPPALLHDEAAPAMLFVDGSVSRLSLARLALLAPAAASAEAIARGVGFAQAFARRGVPLLVHFGSDFSAAIIRSLINLPGADLVAVLDGGPDRISPARQLKEARMTAERGALVTELAPGEKAPNSNRSARLLVASLPRAVLVFEATIGSQTLRTAQQAGVWGKDLFALPGSIDAPLARGCHRLIRDGARLVESVDDVLDEASAYLT